MSKVETYILKTSRSWSRKIVPLMLTFCLAVSFGTTASANVSEEGEGGSSSRQQSYGEVADTSFSDIAGHWAESFIKQVSVAGKLSSYEDGTFRPNQTLSRAEEWVPTK